MIVGWYSVLIAHLVCPASTLPAADEAERPNSEVHLQKRSRNGDAGR